jgi:hypothetical protein
VAAVHSEGVTAVNGHEILALAHFPCCRAQPNDSSARTSARRVGRGWQGYRWTMADCSIHRLRLGPLKRILGTCRPMPPVLYEADE